MKKSGLAFVIAALAAVASLGAIRAVTPTAWNGKPDCWQMKRHLEKMSVVTNGGAEVVFIGDSITHFWESHGKVQWEKYFNDGSCRLLNLGISADRTEHVLWRITDGKALDGYEAKVIFLMIGTNNTGHFPIEKEPPCDTILGIRTILETIRAKQPTAKIVLTAIFPCGAGPESSSRIRNGIVNKEICKYADGKTIFWLDFNDQFLTADSKLPREIFPDLLHPSAHGYEIWATAVKPYIDYALSDGKLPAPGNRYASMARPENFRMGAEVTTYPVTRIMEPNAGRGLDWWSKRILEKRNQISESEGAVDLVMFGDSITHFWEYPAPCAAYITLTNRYTTLNLGYGGDRTEHLVWRGSYGELDGYKAKCIVLMIGTNNGGDAVDSVAAGIRSILDIIAKKQPQATTVLLPIFPRGGKADDSSRVKNEKVNELIQAFADGKKVIWLDFNDKLVDPNGDLTRCFHADRLHPNPQGYQVWLDAMAPTLESIIRE
jgi:lysophospholipase L1-like esterase